MPAQSIDIENRIVTLSAALAKKAEQQAVSDTLTASNSDWTAAAASLKRMESADPCQIWSFCNNILSALKSLLLLEYKLSALVC